MLLLVRRNFVAQYKQTILGPLWFFIQPLFTAGIYSIVFGRLAGIPTDGVPQPVFYLAGTTLWNYFSSCVTTTATTLTANAGLFGKVYFPRLAVPISDVVTRLYTFLIQMLLFLVVYCFYLLRGAAIKPNVLLVLLPLLLVQTGLLGLSVGLWSSALTVKYRDLGNLVGFGVQLWMWATPIVYPLSFVPQKYRILAYLNPVAPLVEVFRYGFTGKGTFPIAPFLCSVAATAVLLFFALILFHRAEETSIDVA
jgi:lipopolysaccharide transport system permease protein